MSIFRFYWDPLDVNKGIFNNVKLTIAVYWNTESLHSDESDDDENEDEASFALFLALALAFGLGGRDVAGRYLEKWLEQKKNE